MEENLIARKSICDISRQMLLLMMILALKFDQCKLVIRLTD